MSRPEAMRELRESGVRLLQGNPRTALELVRRLVASAGGPPQGWIAYRDSAFYLAPRRAA
ncbi:MAG: hypothetical protein NDI82_05130 [Anaeromyxobacteraceae bacterium]|nr:hypothetical protein [Anaeromyxobacteraceae bacterium]